MGSISTDQGVLDLRGCFKKIRDGGPLRDFFLTDHDLVFLVAELALPYLVVVFLYNDAHLVKDGLTIRAQFGVASRHLAFIAQAIKSDLKNVSIELFPVNVGFLMGHCSLLGLELTTHVSLLLAIVAVTEVELTTQII